MVIRKTYRYRLYPNKEQAKCLQWVLDRCRELYNAALEERREAYRMCGQSINFYAQTYQLPTIKDARPEYRAINAQLLEDVLRRVDRAVTAFFRRMKARQKAGYPRFKGYDRYDSFTFRQSGWKLAGERLTLRGIGALKVRLHRPVEGRVKTVTIRREGNQWHVCFSCLLEVADPAQPERPAVGLDVGLEHFATLSDGTHLPNPRHFRQGEARLARRQRALARKKRGSKNRCRAKILTAKAHRRVRNQRQDFHHKTARAIVQAHGAIAIEGLRVANMVRNHRLAKSICDAGWDQFLTTLTSKAEEAGLVVMVVNPAGTSQVCSGCGRPGTVPKDLSVRWHTCPYEDCGLSLQRDHNAARAILNRAGLARAAA